LRGEERGGVNGKLTLTSAEGEGRLKLSEREAKAHITASIVTPKVNTAFALYPKECIAKSKTSLALCLSTSIEKTTFRLINEIYFSMERGLGKDRT
jgi:hypothetical protein